MAPMRRPHPVTGIIRWIDQALLVIVVICFALGGIGTAIQLIRFGFLSEPSGGE